MSSDGPSKIGQGLSHSDTDPPPRPEPLDELILNDDEPIELPPAAIPAVRQSSPPLARPQTTPSVLPPRTPPPRISTRVKASEDVREPSPPTRPKMTLRIPDDEVTRPGTPDGGVTAVGQSRPSAPPLPKAESKPPSRSRLLSAPPVALLDDASPPVADAFVVATPAETSRGPAAGIDAASEPGWTPYQPPVERVAPPRRPSMVDDVASNGAAHSEGMTPSERRSSAPPGPTSEEIPIDMDLSGIASAPDTQEDPGVTDPRLPASLDSEDVRFDESERSDVSEDEVDADDLVSVESLAPTRKPAGAEGVAKMAVATAAPAAQPAPAAAPVAAAPTPVTAAVTGMATAGRAPATISQPPAAPAAPVSPAAPVAAAAAPAASPALRRSPGSLVFVPPVGGLAPPPMTADSLAARKKTRPWWEELFNDDFIRTMAKVTDAQINKEVTFIEESLGCEAGAMVLDLACGTGRHAVSLAERGYQVVGFDLSLAMLARASDEAQDRKQKINFVQGDMREMTFEETFDGVYSWNTSFGYFDEEKNAAVVARVHKALKKGGQFLLDVVNRDYIVRQAPSLAWFEGDGCICMDEMTIDFITSRMKVKRTLMMDDGRTKEIEYSIRAYSLHELGKLLHDNGFRVAEVSGRTGTPGVFFGCESPRTLILAEKR